MRKRWACGWDDEGGLKKKRDTNSMGCVVGRGNKIARRNGPWRRGGGGGGGGIKKQDSLFYGEGRRGGGEGGGD